MRSRAIGQHGLPDKITIDKSGANTAAVQSIQADTGAPVELRQVKYLNNIVEQDHRAIKRIIRPMLSFQFIRSARILLAGIDTMHMIKKGQLDCPNGQVASAADQFYFRAGCAPLPLLIFAHHYFLIATEPPKTVIQGLGQILLSSGGRFNFLHWTR
jgi:hypothetical protein